MKKRSTNTSMGANTTAPPQTRLEWFKKKWENYRVAVPVTIVLAFIVGIGGIARTSYSVWDLLDSSGTGS